MSARVACLLTAAAAGARRTSLLAALRPKPQRLFRASFAAARAAMSLPPGARVPAPVPPPPVPAAPVKVALCQLATGADKAANIAAAAAAVRDAAAAGAQLVVLPEMWNCPYDNASFPAYAEDLSSAVSGASPCATAAPSAAALSAAAAAARVVLVGGSVPERDAQGKLYNTCLVFDAQGRVLAKHRKVHLFDIDILGGITFRESDTLSPGDGCTVVDTACGRLGVGICFDIRFPELALLAASRGAQVLVFPGAFNTVTGPLHWELLARARAVDCQAFVLVCSPARVAGAAYQAWGHSTAVGPFGEVLASTLEAPATVYAELELAQVATRRKAMPLEQQRRGDVYTLVDRRAAGL